MTTTAKKRTRKKSAPKNQVITVVQAEEEQSLPAIRSKGDLIHLAVSKGADIGTVERMVALYENERRERAFRAFHDAMSKLQENLPSIPKNKKGYEGYQYADLDQIIRHIKKPLADHGFTYRFEFKDVPETDTDKTTLIPAILQAIEKFNNDSRIKKDWLESTLEKILSGREVEVTCIVTHRDGHSERTTMTGPEDYSGFKTLIQSRGSSMSYLERYTLIGAFGLTAVDTDNDGAPKTKPTAETKTPEATPGKPLMSVEQLNKAVTRITKGEDILATCKNQFTMNAKQLHALNSADEVRKEKATTEETKKTK